MDLIFVVILVLVLIGFFLVLGFWQRKIDREQKMKTLENLIEAKDRGTHTPLAQYPLIKPTLCIGCGSCIAACPEGDVIGLVNGIATIINGSHCVGHALCQDACPVGAITVGMGKVADRPDLPLLTDRLESTVPGIYIAGELSGMSLIRNAVQQSVTVINDIAEKIKKENRNQSNEIFDVLIIGAGPAGLAATLGALDLKLRFQTISRDDVGGSIRHYPRQKLTLIQETKIPLYGLLKRGEYSKENLLKLWEDLVRKNHINILTGVSLQAVEKRGSFFETLASANTFKSKFVILALGRRGVPRKLGVPGEDLEKVMYQLIETTTYNNLNILVVGGGDSAIEAATGLANQRGNQVTISYRKGSFFRLKKRNEDRIREYESKGRVRVLFSSDVESIESKSVHIKWQKDNRTEQLIIPNDFVFILVGGEPPYPLLKQMGVKFQGEFVGDNKSGIKT